LHRTSWKGIWLDLSYFFLIHPNPPLRKEGVLIFLKDKKHYFAREIKVVEIFIMAV